MVMLVVMMTMAAIYYKCLVTMVKEKNNSSKLSKTSINLPFCLSVFFFYSPFIQLPSNQLFGRLSKCFTWFKCWFNFLPQPCLLQQHSSLGSLSQFQFLVSLLVLQSLGFLIWIQRKILFFS